MFDQNQNGESASISLGRTGHPIDPSVGYARGTILSSPLDESKRFQHAMRLVQRRAITKGASSFFNFTGLHRDYPLPPDKVAFAEEWIGPAFFRDELAELAREHFGGGAEHDVAVFNRATAGIIATCLALSRPGSTVLSVIPVTRSHPSIARGVGLANARLAEVSTLSEVEECLSSGQVSLIVITGVSSELQVMEEEVLLDVVRLGKARGIPTFLDDAYGARLRPLIYGQRKTLETGVEMGITSCDKAGLGGPRAGLMAGRPDLMDRVLAKAAELGLEARPALSLGVCASLAKFEPAGLRREVELGEKIYDQLSLRFGKDRVRRTGLGAAIPEEEAWDLVRSLRPSDAPLPVIPAEITAGVGMYWLEHYGIITVNALGQPGARVSLRFKPDPCEIERFGGISALVEAIDDGLRHIAEKSGSIAEMKQLILGEV
ncbi:MAG: aminotransferase class I/II-fold pyridoxal phosphate-dependent enzyme [Deltaproteobacteria bacterium]|nr:aminotransferase class I/II-fold pyridoxal phosphate-dependent enzyme [Deltaproteobacteria bacterium]